MKILATIFFYFGYGSYYILLKPRFVDLGASYFQILLVDSLPAFVALTSIFWGRLADLISRRYFLLFSALGGVLLFFLGFINNINVLLVFLGLLSIFTSIAFPIINALFSFGKEVEKSFAVYLFAEAIAWTLSGTIMGLLSRDSKLFALGYILSGISWIIGILLYFKIYTGEIKEETKVTSVFKISFGREMWWLAVGIFFLELGIVSSYGVLSVKLYEVLGKSKLLYGIVWASVPAFLSAVVSNAYGRVVKKLNPWGSLALCSGVYFVNILVLSVSKGYLMAFFWVLPLWNFLYIAMYSAVTMVSKEAERATAFGFMNSVINLSSTLSVLAGSLADRWGRNVSVGFGLLMIFTSFLVFLSIFGRISNDNITLKAK